ncbi:MAG: RHS repeat-associated core domain-containing protein, partial [Candidatus Sulfotelmatobacter sp.]
RYDSNINLYHLRARYYNMLTGRFETMDPELGKIFDPGTLHKYVYAQSNPVNRIDPSGRDAPEYVFQLEVDIEVKSPLSLEMRATEQSLQKAFQCVANTLAMYESLGTSIPWSVALDYCLASGVE